MGCLDDSGLASGVPPVNVERRNVLFLLGSLRQGGMEQVVLELLRGLDRSRFRPFLLTFRGSDEALLKVLPGDVEVRDLGKCPGRDFGVCRKIAAYIRDARIHLVHSHNWETWLYAYLGVVWARSSVLIHAEHGRDSEDVGESFERRWCKRFLGWRTPFLTTVSTEIAGMFGDYLWIPSRKITTIPNGVDLERYRPASSREAAKAVVGFSAKRFLLGTVIGSLRPVKDVVTLLHSFRILCEHKSDVELAIVGGSQALRDGKGEMSDYEKMILNLAGELGVRDRAHFVGPVLDVEKYLPAFDVYVNTSRYEGTSLAILDALACGVPVVATRVGGTPMILSHEETGLLVPPESPEQVAEAVLRLRSGDLSERLQSAGRRLVEDQFNRSTMIAAYESVYERACSTSSADRRG